MAYRIAFLLIGIVLLVNPTHAGLDGFLKDAGKLLGGEKSASTGGSALTDGQINEGLKEALSVGAERAVDLLGKSGGFLNDPKVHIPLPGALQTVGKTLRTIGMGERVDAFEETMNRAAEQAVPKTLEIIKNTISALTLEDVRGILSGGDDAATQFLRKRAGGDLHQAILPIVSDATDSAGATAAYKDLKTTADASTGGLLDTSSLDLDKYVTDKALDGLFYKLAIEEKAIRENPVARTTDILKQVFGN